MHTHTARKRKFRVLLFNLGYATGLDGSLWGYCMQWYRYLYTPRLIIRQIRHSLYQLLSREQPDLCCFIEIHHKHGFVPHPHAYRSHIDNKYGRWSMRRFLPFYRDNCNGFFSRQPLAFTKRFFTHGAKKLIYDIQIGNGFSLLLVHFSLHRKTRRKQQRELRDILNGRENVILCGDFNDFRGTRELSTLAESCHLKIVNAHSRTFPAIHPRKALDLFLCPKSMESASARVLSDVHVSDHLPVMLELAL